MKEIDERDFAKKALNLKRESFSIKKGSEIMHITSNPNFEPGQRPLFTTFQQNDKRRYIANFNPRDGKDPYLAFIKLKKDLNVGSEKESLEVFKKLLNSDLRDDILRTCNSTKPSMNFNFYKDLFGEKGNEDYQELLRDFHSSFSKDTMTRSNIEFMSEMYKKGFNSWIDSNNAGMFGDSPIIIADPSALQINSN